MIKKVILLFVLLSNLLMACSSNDDVKQVTYEGEARIIWIAELEYQEEVRDDGQINAEIDLELSINDDTLGQAEIIDGFSYRLELEDTLVFEGTLDETGAASVVYITGEAVIENPFPDDGVVMLGLEWYGNQQEFPLERIEEE